MDLTKEVKIQWCHPVVIGNMRKEVHENQLTVSFSTIPRLLVCRSFMFRAALYNNDGRCPATGDSYIEYYVSSVKKTYDTESAHCNDQHRPSLYSPALIRTRPQCSSSVWDFRTSDRLPATRRKYLVCSSFHRPP